MKKLLLILMFSSSAYADQYSDLSAALEKINTPHGIRQKVNKDKAKAEAIFGEWDMTYSIAGKVYNDKLRLSDTYVSASGDIMSSGSLTQHSGTAVNLVLCAYNPNDFTLISVEYVCVSRPSQYYQIHAFKYSGDIITSGQYSIADSADSAALGLILKLAPITGRRLSYRSDYAAIEWVPRAGHNDYCIDITDENWNVFPGFQAIRCGKNMQSFSPQDYVTNVMKLPRPVGFRFNWRVWSGNKGAQGNILPGSAYGGPGYEGKVIVQ